MRPYQVVNESRRTHQGTITLRLQKVKVRGRLPLFAKLAWNRRKK